VLANSERHDLVDFHFGLGMFIRNQWLYPDGSELREKFFLASESSIQTTCLQSLLMLFGLTLTAMRSTHRLCVNWWGGPSDLGTIGKRRKRGC
jgi:hypothetical protein